MLEQRDGLESDQSPEFVNPTIFPLTFTLRAAPREKIAQGSTKMSELISRLDNGWFAEEDGGAVLRP